MQFFILFQFVQFFQFRVFLIKKSCQFLMSCTCVTCILYLKKNVNEVFRDKNGEQRISCLI